ncbi:carbon-nitrogen hydrolase family protein [Thermosediminibacter litoriperuensis]|uniref:Carbon-nitrogen hydrolase n=1 Tax=Thermosediminibacter litoriperuensis TaxID=291989 RepID=A0A5S5AJ96_9FIRM|nr:carbon-nitrogen hydrolase family protein [Thermosediminibacter litoriperuensis]TYP49258.1 carbon-nitrogen hydrolase [Thermosediminibacter litoriperuensis]
MVKACALQLRFENKEKYIEDIKKYIRDIKADILVLPPLAGLLFSSSAEYLQFHLEFSKGKDFVLVPGSFFEDGYHKAVIMQRGRILHTQCQTHLSAQDARNGLKRGDELDICSTAVGNVGILVGNDCFHPQTGRILGLQGADIVVGLYTVEGDYNRWLQLSGIWQQVQQNQFFAVECAANGRIRDKIYAGRSIIHNPIWEGSNGILGEMKEGEEGVLAAVLDFEKRNEIKAVYPLYKYLNRKLYKKEWGY